MSRHALIGPIIGSLLAVTIAATTSAQTLTLGAKAGVNVSTLQIEATDLIITPSNRVGVQAGVYVQRRLKGALGVQIEGLISQKGTIIEDPRFEGELKVRVNYLDIAVLGRYQLTLSPRTTVQFLAGPVFSFKVGDKQQIGSEVLEEGEKQVFTSRDFGLSVGGAVTIRNVLVDVRYVFGVANVNDDLDRDELIVRNRALSVSVGWRLK